MAAPHPEDGGSMSAVGLERDPRAGQDGGEAEVPGPARVPAATSWRVRPRTAASVLAVLLVVAVALAAVLGVLAWQAHRRDSDATAAVAAARQVAVNLTTMKADTADQDLQRLLESATGEFRSEFADRQQPFVQVVKQAKVSTVGDVVGAGLDRLDGTTARVLVAVHSTVKNAAAQQGEPRDYRLAVTMQQIDDRWLASGVEFVR